MNTMSTLDSIDILLAEDNEFDAEMTIRSLKNVNFPKSLHWVKNGQEALDFLFCQGDYSNRVGMQLPKLLLLDLKMPKINGLDVLERLKLSEHLRVIPVVIMTSSDQQLDIARAYRLGVNSYIVKPMEMALYTKTIQDLGNYWLTLNRGNS